MCMTCTRLLLLLSAGMAAYMLPGVSDANLKSLKQDGEGQHAICLSKCTDVHVQQCLDNWTKYLGRWWTLFTAYEASNAL